MGFAARYTKRPDRILRRPDKKLYVVLVTSVANIKDAGKLNQFEDQVSKAISLPRSLFFAGVAQVKKEKTSNVFKLCFRISTMYIFNIF